MDVASVMSQLAGMGNVSRQRVLRKIVPDVECFGVLLGPLRKWAKQEGPQHAVALELWETGNADAQVFAGMLLDPKALTEEEAVGLVAKAVHPGAITEVTAQLGQTGFAEDVRARWLGAAGENERRSAWMLTAWRVNKKKAPLEEATALVDQIAGELGGAPASVQEPMNQALCFIGIEYDELTERCLEIGHRLGVYRDYKVAKGCTSPFAPEWIALGRSRKAQGR
jgi:3-methyladenine DNA glycosylase AlkD